MNPLIGSVEAGGTKMVGCIYDRDFRCLARCKRKTRSENGGEAPLTRMAAVVREAMDEAGVPWGRLSGVGVGLAGMLDLDKGILIDAPNLGWSRLKVADGLRKRLHAPVTM